MKIKSVTIENFLTIGTAEVDLADRGLILIQGENRDDSSAESNGSGKSSLADAVCWAIYGVTARGEDGDKVVNRFSDGGKNCRVSVVIEDGGEIYQITRYRKHKTGKNTVDLHKITSGTGPALSLTKGTNALTDAEIVKLVGSSYDVFKASIYAGQERMPDLPGMTDKQLKVLVEEAAGSDLLEAAAKEANEALLTTKKALVEAQNILLGMKTRESDTLATLARMEASRDELDERNKEKIAALKDSARESGRKAKELAEQIAKSGEAALLKEIDELTAKIAGVNGERETEKELAEQVSLANRKMSVLHHELATLKDRAEREKKELDNVAHKVGCPCGECAKPITNEDLEPVRKAISEKLRTTIETFKAKKEALANAQTALQSATAALDAHRSAMTDISAISALLTTKQNEQAEIKRLKSEMDNAVVMVKHLIGQAKEIEATPNPFDHQIEDQKVRIQKLQMDVVDQEKKLEKLAIDLSVDEVVAKVFSPTGVRAHILDEVTPFLNDQTAKYLGTLSDGNISATWSTLVKNAKGELKEKFSIEVENAKGGDTFSLISGGEKRKVRIAAALALQDLVSRRATKPIELFIGDEIDDALDSAGLERLTTILEEKARERGSVFIISHNDLKDWVPNALTVIKEKGVSRIEEVTA